MRINDTKMKISLTRWIAAPQTRESAWDFASVCARLFGKVRPACRQHCTGTRAPQTLILTFTESLEVPFCSVAVADSMGMNDAGGKPQAVPGHPDQLSVPLNISMPGTINVTRHAVSVDTHKTERHFVFTVSQ